VPAVPNQSLDYEAEARVAKARLDDLRASLRRLHTALGDRRVALLVVVMQENRSFDHCFGTYPCAYGIPQRHGGVPSVCRTRRLPDASPPHHDSTDAPQAGRTPTTLRS
jgi:phospholipase C